MVRWVVASVKVDVIPEAQKWWYVPAVPRVAVDRYKEPRIVVGGVGSLGLH